MFMSEKVRKGMEAGSWIRRMFDEGAIMKKKYGADKVFDLTLGNPIIIAARELANGPCALHDHGGGGHIIQK